MPDNVDQSITRFLFEYDSKVFDEMDRAFTRNNALLDNMTNAYTKLNKETGETTIVAEGFNDKLEKLSVTLSVNEDKVEVLSEKLLLSKKIQDQATESLRGELLVRAELNRAFEKSKADYEELLKIEERKARNEQHEQILKDAKAQHQLNEDLAAGHARYEEIIKDEERRKRNETHLQILEDAKAQHQLNETLAAGHARYEQLIRDEQTRQTLATQNSQAASLVAGLRGAAPIGATSSELNREAVAWSNLVKFIEQGQISVQRFTEILNSLKTASGQTFSGVEAQVQSAAERYRLAAENMGAESRKIAEELARVGRSGEKAANLINLSWQSVSRFFAVHILYTAVYRLTGALREATNAAGDFERRIAEIQTISQEAEKNTGQWIASLRQLSDEFGRPISEIAEANYEAISNQVVNATNSVNFLTEALKLARVTASTTDDSVSLLSSVINGYQLNANQAANISSKLFTIIDLGRVRAEEIANTFGRVGVISHSLGVSFEEVGAALATITRAGVKPHEALTLINNVILKLAKPTDELKEVFKDLGVANGQAAIAAFGFGGTLKKLEEAAHGSRSELIEMFRDIRAVRGALGLTDAFDAYSRDLDKITNSTERYNNAVKLIDDNAGFRLQEQLERIKNIFTVDIGVEFVEHLKALNEELRTFGIDGLVGGFKDLFGIMTKVVAIFGIYKTATVTLAYVQEQLANKQLLAAVKADYLAFKLTDTAYAAKKAEIASLSWQASLTRIASSVGIGIAITAIAYYFQKLVEEQQTLQELAEKTFKEQKDKSDELTRVHQENLDKQSAAFKKNTEQKFAALIQFNTKVLTELEKIKDKEQDLYNDLAENTRNKLTEFVNSIQDNIRNLGTIITTASTRIKSNTKEIAESGQKVNEILFDFKIKGLTEDKQFEEVKKQAEKRVTDFYKSINKIEVDISNKKKSGKVNAHSLELTREDIDNSKKNAEELQKFYIEQGNKAIALRKQKEELEKELAKQTTKIVESEEEKKQKALIRSLEQSRTTNRELFDARSKLKQLQESNSSSNNNREREELQTRLKLIDQQLKAIGSTAEIAQKILDIEKERNRLRQDAIDLEKQQADAAKAEQDKEKQRLIELRTLVANINKFKITDAKGNLKYKTADEAIVDFEKLITDAKKKGAEASPELLNSLLQQEQEIRKNYNIKFAEDKLKILQDTAQKERDLIIQSQQSLNTLIGNQNKLALEKADVLIAGFTRVKAELLEATKREKDSGNGPDAFKNEISDVQNLIERLETFKRTGNVDLLSKLGLDLKTIQAIDQSSYIRDFEFNGKQYDFQNLFKLLQLIKSNQSTYNDNIKKAQDNITSQQNFVNQLESQITNLSNSFNTLGSNITVIFNNAIKGMDQLLKNVDDFNKGVNDSFKDKGLNPNDNTDPNFDPLKKKISFNGNINTPNIAPAIASNTSSFSFGDFNVTVQGGGPNQMSVQEFADKFQQTVRMKLVNLA